MIRYILRAEVIFLLLIGCIMGNYIVENSHYRDEMKTMQYLSSKSLIELGKIKTVSS